MDGGGREPLEGKEELVMDGKDTRTGESHPMGLRDFLQGGGAGGSYIQVRDVGDDSPHGTGPGKFPALGRQADYR